MNPEKYNRNINMLCPTCGSSDFLYEQGSDQTIELMTCALCGREFTKDELMQENSENINEHLSEIKAEVSKDLVKELQDSFKKSFRGNKNIRFK